MQGISQQWGTINCWSGFLGRVNLILMSIETFGIFFFMSRNSA
jgi:hypothetical protein